MKDVSASPATVGESLLYSVSPISRGSVPPGDDSKKWVKGNNDALATMARRKRKEAAKGVAEFLGDGADEASGDDGAGDDGGVSCSKQYRKVKDAASQQYVDHTYTDFAIVNEDDLRLLDENSSLLPKSTCAKVADAREKLKGMRRTYGPMKKSAGGVVQPFPGKLLKVLDRTDLADIIGWMPHGRSFIVKKPKLFTTNVLPRFFKQTKFLSFTRQLNLWGFKRITRGVDAGAYYHKLFLRRRPYLAMRMRRQKIKGTGMKLSPDPDGEPDFYHDWPAMPKLNEREVLPPLPPLPAERLRVQAGVSANRDGEGMLDGVSKNMINALKFSAAAAGTGAGRTAGPIEESVTSFLWHQQQQQKNASNLTSAFTNSEAIGNHIHNHSEEAAEVTKGAAGFPGAPITNPMGGGYQDLLLTPGMSPLENALRLRYSTKQQQKHSANIEVTRQNVEGLSGRGLNPDDPTQGELTALIHGPYEQQVPLATAQAPAIGLPTMESSMFATRQLLSSDRLLMERLRDLDKAQQNGWSPTAVAGAAAGSSRQGMKALPRAGMSSLSNAHLRKQTPLHRSSFQQSQILPLGNLPSQGSSASTPLAGGLSAGGKGLGLAPSVALAPGCGLQSPLAAYVGRGRGNPDDPVETSVNDALREADHLEQLALAQRAKARSLALAGALQSRFGDVGGVGGAGGISDGSGSGVPSLLSPVQKDGNLCHPLGDQLPSRTNSGPPGVSEGGGRWGLTNGSGSMIRGDSRPSFGRPFGRKESIDSLSGYAANH